MARGRWTNRTSKGAFLCGLAAAVIGLTSALLARADVIPKLPGFLGVALGMIVALVGVILGLIGLVLAWRASASPTRPLIGLLLSAAYVGLIVGQLAPSRGLPAIHDVTTDPANPPAFTVIPLGADNLRGVGTVEKWRELHAQAYADIQPIALPLTPAQVITRATELAQARGWTIALADPAAGRLEATESVSLIGFKDDIVIVATPVTGGSLVNARSVSRVGTSDVGVNAKRLREFLAELKG